MPVFQLLKTNNYFISSEGFVFKIEQGKEVRVYTWRTKRSNLVMVSINDKEYDLFNLMLQYFVGESIKITDKVKYTVTKDLMIPANSIRIKPALGLSNSLSAEDEAKIFKYKCAAKASSANSRSLHKINAIQVYRTLEIHQFRCIYCHDNIQPKNWHLDHYTPLSTYGRNIIENIVPSCNVCNIMKGALDGLEFYRRCQRVVNGFMFKPNDDTN